MPSRSTLTEQDRAKLRSLLATTETSRLTLAVGMLRSLEVTEAEWSELVSPETLARLAKTWDRNVWQVLADGLKDFPQLIRRFADYVGPSKRKRRERFLVSLFPDLDAAMAALVMPIIHRCHPSDLQSFVIELETISPEAAKALAGYAADLNLNGLKTLSEETAQAS